MYIQLLYSFGAFFVGAVALQMGRRVFDNALQAYRRTLNPPEEKVKAGGAVGFYKKGLS